MVPSILKRWTFVALAHTIMVHSLESSSASRLESAPYLLCSTKTFQPQSPTYTRFPEERILIQKRYWLRQVSRCRELVQRRTSIAQSFRNEWSIQHNQSIARRNTGSGKLQVRMEDLLHAI